MLPSSLVAMGFTAQVPNVFGPFMAVVLPSIFVLGCFTVVRLVDTTVENNQNLRAIAHIRRYYRTLSPEAATFFASWQASDDDAAEALAMLGTKPRRATVMFTTASMVAAINSLVGGVTVALLTAELAGPRMYVPAILLGIVATAAFIGVAYRYQVRRYSAAAAADRNRRAPSTT